MKRIYEVAIKKSIFSFFTKYTISYSFKDCIFAWNILCITLLSSIMKKTTIILLLATLLSNSLYLRINAQNLSVITSSTDLYMEGRQLFLHKDYVPAMQMLEQFLRGRILAKDRQEAEYMLACIDYELKMKNAIGTLRDYLERYPDTPYANRIYSLMASAYFYKGDFDEAIAVFNSCDLSLLGNEERDACTYRLAMSYLKVGQLQQASLWFRTLEGSSIVYRHDALYNLAYIDYVQQRYDKALPVFLSLQKDVKYKEIVPYYIAEVYCLKKNYDKSEIVAEGYLSAYPNNEHSVEMYRILGISRYYLEKYAEAAQALQTYADAVKKPNRDALYLLGMSYYRTKVFSKAAEEFGEVTMLKDALSQNAYLHMGLAYLQLQDKAKARMAFEQAASMTFDAQIREEALYNYALCIHETSYSPFDESVTVFERFLNEYPASRYASRVSDYLVEVYMNTRSYEAALKSIAKISRPDARILEANQKILFQLGTQSFANARFDEAIDYFNRSLELSRYNMQTKADAYYWRGEAYYRLNRFADAGRNLRMYLEFTTSKDDDMYALAYYTLGYVDFKQKDYTGAQKWFTRYVNLPQVSDKSTLADSYNRIGDCSFYARRFADAQQDYSKAVQLEPSLGDYSLYQEAFVLGLQKDYLGKIHVLNKLIGEYPSSQYQDDAYYERGRAYVMMEDNSRAIDSFRELLDKFPESAVARKGANEIGLLYYQDDQYKDAIQAYKHVIATYPGSEEARLAQRDLKSIYVDLNKVDEYAEFVSSIPGGTNFDVSERDSLTYMAAEKAYMRGDIVEAKNSFVRYLQSFPEGAFSLNAHYYIGLTNYNQKKFQEALSHLEKVLEFPDNKYSENAMVLSSEILFSSRDYVRSLAIYKQLKEKASTEDRRLLAKTGILRSAYLLNDEKEMIHAATALLGESKLAPELSNEAYYYRAKAYLGQQADSFAIKDLTKLAVDTRNLYGAEAKYLLAQLYFDSGETEKAEQEVLNYIDCSTPHAYWLARSFVLLSDVYMKMGRDLDAKQYLLSLQQNYRADDDIENRIEIRLKELNK